MTDNVQAQATLTQQYQLHRSMLLQAGKISETSVEAVPNPRNCRTFTVYRKDGAVSVPENTVPLMTSYIENADHASLNRLGLKVNAYDMHIDALPKGIAVPADHTHHQTHEILRASGY